MAQSSVYSTYDPKKMAQYPTVSFKSNNRFRAEFLRGLDECIQRVKDLHPNSPGYASKKLVFLRDELKKNMLHMQRDAGIPHSSIRKTLCDVCGLKNNHVYSYGDELRLFRHVMLVVYDKGILNPSWNTDIINEYEAAKNIEEEYATQQMILHQEAADNWEWDNWS